MLIETLVAVFYGYAGLGAVFGLYFVIRGAARIDDEARHLPFLLRLLLWPGSVALWPVLLRKIWQSKPVNAPLTGADHSTNQLTQP